jgi:hypothetical protein
LILKNLLILNFNKKIPLPNLQLKLLGTFSLETCLPQKQEHFYKIRHILKILHSYIFRKQISIYILKETSRVSSKNCFTQKMSKKSKSSKIKEVIKNTFSVHVSFVLNFKFSLQLFEWKSKRFTVYDFT